MKYLAQLALSVGLFMVISVLYPQRTEMLFGIANQVQSQLSNYKKPLNSNQTESLDAGLNERGAHSPVTDSEPGLGDQHEPYVLINGKYYRRRADNIYTIDGEKILHIDNKKRELTPDEGVKKQVRNWLNKTSGQGLSAQTNTKNVGSNVKKGAANRQLANADIELGDTPKNQLEVEEILRKADRATQERERTLEQILDD